MGELDSEVKSSLQENLSQLLFGPVFLIGEVIGILLPGITFSVLLAEKGLPSPAAIFHLTYIGYRTKILGFLLISYVIGRLLNIPVSPILVKAVKVESGGKEIASGREFMYPLLAGLVAAPSLLGKSRIADYLMLAYAALCFEFGVGAALLIGGSLPGDGYLRIAEVLCGGLLFLKFFASTRTIKDSVVAFVGFALYEFLRKIPLERWPLVFQIGQAILNPKSQQQSPPPATGVAGSAT
jgi:hypothetical protein